MNILVTGGSGFLGAYLIAALRAEGHHVINFDIAPPRPDLSQIDCAASDQFTLGAVSDIDLLRNVCRNARIELIVHAAALLGFEPSVRGPDRFYEVNVMGFVNVCEVARQLHIDKVVLISSNAVYHAGAGKKLVERDMPFSVFHANPAAHYGTSKMAAEAIGMCYAEFHGLDFLAVRVTAVYGFGMRSPLHIKPMVENAIQGKPTRFASGGSMRRDYTYVLDCVDAVVRVVSAPRRPTGAQRIFNVSAGKILTVSQVADVIRTVIPEADIEVGSQLTPLEAANVRMRAPLDGASSQATFGWSSRWTIEAGIRDYVERFRRYAEGPAQHCPS